MKQVYVEYYKWECYKSGMWNRVSKENELKMLELAIKFMSYHIEYGSAMNKVVFLWEKTMRNHLTNKSINHRAFVGHCAVCFKHQIPEYITRKAWSHLNENQRALANLEADKNILLWKREYMKKLMNTSTPGKKDVTKMGYQTKLQLD